jgi:histidine triad (HIT) family protein
VAVSSKAQATWSAALGPYKLRPMGDTIFSKILRGDIPCHKVYEDELVFAFLDIGPLSFGHTLVIPKEEVATLDQLSDETAAAIGRVLPRLCRALKAVTGAEQFNILQNNGPMAHQAVYHVHFHIIPKPSVDRGLVMEWASTKLDPDEGARLAAALNKEIGG